MSDKVGKKSMIPTNRIYKIDKLKELSELAEKKIPALKI